jgi:hypothetical protein
MDEVRKITRPPISASPVLIYKRQGQWRSVAYFGTRAAASKELATIRTLKPDAYIVDISAWCPTPVKLSAETTDMAELKDCQF